MTQFLARVLAALLFLIPAAQATVGTTTNSVTAQGNGATTAFNYAFPIPVASDAVVVYTDTTGASTTLLPTQYTITGIGIPTGGTVTYPLTGSPIASGTTLTIERIVPYTQTVSISSQGPTFQAIENALDGLTYQTQQLNASIGRSIQIPLVDPLTITTTLPAAAQRANLFVGFDASGNVIATGGPSNVPISAAMTPVVQASTLALGRTALGLGTVATLNTGTAAGNIPVLQSNSGNVGFAALDGSLLTNLPIGVNQNYKNKLRNSSMTAWFHGASQTITTSGGWGAEGLFVVPTGASVAVAQNANGLSSPLTFYSMKITGAASVTDVVVRFVIESYDAAPLAGGNVTCQFPVLNNTGGSITPTLTVKRPTSQDNYSSTVTDTGPVNLQTVTNGSTGTLAYTFVTNASSFNGLSVDIDFGNNFSSNAKSIQIGGGFDCRQAPGVSTGLNNAPPIPDIRDAGADMAWNARFYQSTYDNGVAPGTVASSGEILFNSNAGGGGGSNWPMRVTMRATQSIQIYNPNTGATNTCHDGGGGNPTVSLATGLNEIGMTITVTGTGSAIVVCHATADATIPGA